MAREQSDYQDRGPRRYDRDSPRDSGDPRREFEREVRRLKKDFQKNVLPAVKRHASYVSRSEMRRVKERKAARRRRRQLRKFAED